MLIICLVYIPFSSSAQRLSAEDQNTISRLEATYNRLIGEDKKSEAGKSLNDIAYIYWSSNMYLKAVEYFKKSLEINKTIQNENAIWHINQNIGMLYSEAEMFSEAVNYQEKSLNMAIKYGGKKQRRDARLQIAITYQVLGSFKAAIKHLEKALAYSLEFKDNKNTRECFLRLSEAYLKIGNGEKSKEYRQKYSSFDKFIKEEEHKKELDISKQRTNAEYQEKLKKEKELDTLTGELKITEDELNKVSEEKEQREKEIKILNEKIKLERELQEAERRKNIIVRNSLIAIGALILILAFAILIGYNVKRKANIKLEEQNIEIKKQKDHIVEKSKELELAFEQIREKNQQIKDSINYAQNIQRAMLPNTDFISQKTKEGFILFKPRDVVSGDFYWFSPDPSDKDSFFVSAVDCTGHGVPGAFMSMIGYKLLDEAISNNILKPNEILSFLSKGVCTLLRQKETANHDGMDIAICRVNKREKKIEFAGAQNPLIYIYNDELFKIKGDRKGIGGEYVDHDFTLHTVDYAENIQFYIFSDGFADQFGGRNGNKFMSKNFRELLHENSKKSMNEQEKVLSNAFEQWKGEQGQVDDVLLIGIKL